MQSLSKSKWLLSFQYRLPVWLLPVVVGLTIPAVSRATICKYAYTQTTADIEGVPVLMEQYIPVKTAPVALIFMLHGSAGVYSVSSKREPTLDNFGKKDLASHCFIVILPHYFQALHRSSLTSLDEMAESSPRLLRIADLLLTAAEHNASFPDGPVFLYGESLGGFLATSLAFTRTEVRGLSVVSSGYVGDTTAKPLNPHLSVLLSHGTTDQLVPIAQALQLCDYCLKFGVPVTLETYKGIEHYFPPAQRLQCIDHTEAFFTSLSRTGK